MQGLHVVCRNTTHFDMFNQSCITSCRPIFYITYWSLGSAAGSLVLYMVRAQPKNWNNCLNQGEEVYGICAGHQRSFWQDCQNDLLAKLESKGVPEKLHTWIGSFLSDRSISVSLFGEVQSPHLPTPVFHKEPFLAHCSSTSSLMAW